MTNLPRSPQASCFGMDDLSKIYLQNASNIGFIILEVMFEPHFKEKLPKISQQMCLSNIQGCGQYNPPMTPSTGEIERPSRRSLESVASTRSVLARWIVAQLRALNFLGPAKKVAENIIWSFGEVK